MFHLETAPIFIIPGPVFVGPRAKLSNGLVLLHEESQHSFHELLGPPPRLLRGFGKLGTDVPDGFVLTGKLKLE